MPTLKLIGKLRPLSNHVTNVSAVYKSTAAPALHEADGGITDATPKPFSEMPGKYAQDQLVKTTTEYSIHSQYKWFNYIQGL